ncbi:TrmH family RNA methyltransferase [Pseudolysinimonas sp.]|uniref:TrmH family RNA methyltransferase n=1 Tax=Pseudolysinimonas sp. TaxID=2680009 RepID=UPI003F80569C
MHVVPITDPGDPSLRDYRDLTDVVLRRLAEPEGGLYLAESVKVIERALRAGHRPRSALVLPKWVDEVGALLADSDIPVYVGESDVLESITGFVMHRGALASMHRPELPSVASLLQGARRIVVLEDIVDHTNVGAIFRNGAALGVDAVLVTPRCADPLYRRSVRVSMGTVFQVPWTRIEDWEGSGLDLVRSLGFRVAAFGLRDDAIPLDAYAASAPERLALVFGTEGEGLLPSTMAAADDVVMIPMSGGVDSLNVASATGIAIWATRP